ncbi:zinc finger, CCHC-type containing protein [Tanacetum coccineum]
MRDLMVHEGCNVALEALPVDMEEGEKSGGSSQLKSMGGTGKLKCFICHSEGHLKRVCQIKKSSGSVRKGIRKGKIQLHDGSSFILEDVRYVLELRRSLILVGTFEKEGYTVKMQMGRVNVSNDDDVVTQRWLEYKQIEEKTNTGCLETATYGKIYDDIDLFKDSEADFSAIVYNDALASDLKVSSEPTVSPHNAIKADFDFTISFFESDDEDYTFIYDKNSSFIS